MRTHIAAPVGVVVVAAGIMAGALWRVRPGDQPRPKHITPPAIARDVAPTPKPHPMEMTGDAQDIEDPLVVTEHGLSVGMPLAAVLTLNVRHRCELITGIDSSLGPVHRIVRCWVGPEPAHYRYVGFLPDRSFASPEAQFGMQQELPEPDPPTSGKALDTWIEGSDLKIELILWRRAPVDES